MILYKDVLLYAACFLLATLAAMVRQRARQRRLSTAQWMWSSFYSGFTALSAVLGMTLWGTDPRLALGLSVSIGLLGTEALNIVRGLMIDILRARLTPPGGPPGGRSDASL